MQGEELTPTVYQHIGYTDFTGFSPYPSGTKESGDGYLGNPSVVFTAAADSNRLQYALYGTSSSVTYTLSFYIKRISGSGTVKFRHTGSTSPVNDISVTSEWQRVQTSILGDSTMFVGVQLLTAGDSVEIAMPQLEEGTTATDFVPNTTGSPKFIASATYGPRVPMLLIEPSATNLLLYSEDFTQWNLGDSQTLLNQITSPDGLNNGAKLNTSNVTNQSYASQSISVVASNTYTFSVYAKKGEQKYLCLVGLNPFTESYFDLESGTALSNNATSSSIEDVGGGWFRLTATFDADTSTKFVGIYLSETGSSLGPLSIPNNEGVYIWGAQVEQGSVATSYIPTSGGDVNARTRQADDLVIDGSNFTDFYNATEGTVYVEYEPKVSSTTNTLLEISNGTNDERIFSLAYSSYHVYPIDGGVSQGVIDLGDIQLNTLNRLSFSYKANNIIGSLNGGSVNSPTTSTIPTVDRLTLGNQALSPNRLLNGHIKRLIYWPTHSDSL